MKIIIGLILFILKYLKVLFKLISTQFGGVVAAIIDTIKTIGISKIIVIWFMLNFIIVGLFNFIFVDHKFMVFLQIVVKTIIASEREIINQIETLNTITGGVTWSNFWLVVNTYLLMLGAIFVLVYLFKGFNWFLSKIVTNESFKGIGVWVISLIIITLLEVIGLIFLASSSGMYDNLTQIPINELTPFQGLWAITQNINGILHPFTEQSIDTLVDNIPDINLNSINDINMSISPEDKPGLINWFRTKF